MRACAAGPAAAYSKLPICSVYLQLPNLRRVSTQAGRNEAQRAHAVSPACSYIRHNTAGSFGIQRSFGKSRLGMAPSNSPSLAARKRQSAAAPNAAAAPPSEQAARKPSESTYTFGATSDRDCRSLQLVDTTSICFSSQLPSVVFSTSICSSLNLHLRFLSTSIWCFLNVNPLFSQLPCAIFSTSICYFLQEITFSISICYFVSFHLLFSQRPSTVLSTSMCYSSTSMCYLFKKLLSQFPSVFLFLFWSASICYFLKKLLSQFPSAISSTSICEFLNFRGLREAQNHLLSGRIAAVFGSGNSKCFWTRASGITKNICHFVDQKPSATPGNGRCFWAA